MNDNKIKRRDTSYTTVAVKDGKKRFFFRTTPRFFLEVHQVNYPAAQMFFLNENFAHTHTHTHTHAHTHTHHIFPDA